MKKILTIIASVMLVGGAAYAQSGLLKGLGDKAKQAAGQQIKKNALNALGLGGGDTQEPAAVSSTYYDTEPAISYAQDLMDAGAVHDFSPEVVNSSYKFKTYKDALKARLELPGAGSLKSVGDYQAYAAKQADVHQGVIDLCTAYSQMQTVLTNQSLHGPYLNQVAPGGNAAMAISSEEVFKAIQDAGLNPATATEEQIQDVVAAYIAGKSGMSKAQVMQKMNEEKAAEKPEHRIKQIQEELSGIYETQLMSGVNAAQGALTSIQNSLLGGKAAVDETTLSGSLFMLNKKIAAAWPKSEECKAVNKLEMEQGQKGRARQNEIIDKWNAKQLDVWVARIAKFIDAEAATATKVAELDAELDSMSEAEKKTADWADAKLSVIKLNGTIISYMDIPGRVFDCPLVSHAPEAQ